MADWGGLYLRQDLGASAALAALALLLLHRRDDGRARGRRRVNRRIGPVALLRWGALLTGVPLAAMLLIGAARPRARRPVPGRPRRRQRRAADVQRRRAPARHAARARRSRAVSSMGSLGFLAGPPFIGFARRTPSRCPGRSRLLILGAVVVFALARRATARTVPEPGAAARAPSAVPGRVRFAAVISDLDGVLVDSVAATRRAWTRLGRAPRARRRGDTGRQPRPPGRASDRGARRRRLARRRGGASAARRRGGRDATACWRSPARPTCSTLPPSRSAPRARCRSPARASRAAGLRVPDVS